MVVALSPLFPFHLSVPAATTNMMFNLPKLQATLKKALAFNSKPTAETFPELGEVVLWMRFVLALVYGTFLGMQSTRSGTMVLNSLNLIAFVPILYTKLYLGADPDYEGTILFSGLVNALALCLLIWIYMFTLENEASEVKLSALLLDTVMNHTETEETMASTTTTTTADSEF